MILIVNKKEIATMVLHMHIMRNPYKNVIKARYKTDKEKMVESYDFILKSVKEALTGDLEVCDLHLNIRDAEMLNSFLKAYVKKLHDTYKKIGIQKINKMDYEQMKMLEGISERITLMTGEVYAK